MKHKQLIIAAIIFFVIINTTYYWEGDLGAYAIVTTLLLLLAFLLLAFALIGQIFHAIRERFKIKQRIIIIALLTLVLTSTVFKPTGLINFDRYAGKDLLIAEREGAANCMTTVKFKEGGKFVESNFCFGSSRTIGNYEVKGDTIFFRNVSLARGKDQYYQFAVIKAYDLVRYKDYGDTTGHELSIVRNELVK